MHERLADLPPQLVVEALADFEDNGSVFLYGGSGATVSAIARDLNRRRAGVPDITYVEIVRELCPPARAHTRTRALRS